MEPADFPDIPDAERLWIAEAFAATTDTKVVTKVQMMSLGTHAEQKITLVLGSSVELAIYPGQSRTSARSVFGSFLLDRAAAQHIVDALARDFKITADPANAQS